MSQSQSGVRNFNPSETHEWSQRIISRYRQIKSGVKKKEEVPIDQMELKLFKNGESPRLCTNSRLVYYRMLKEFQEEGEPDPPVPVVPTSLKNKDPTLNSNASNSCRDREKPFYSHTDMLKN